MKQLKFIWVCFVNLNQVSYDKANHFWPWRKHHGVYSAFTIKLCLFVVAWKKALMATYYYGYNYGFQRRNNAHI